MQDRDARSENDTIKNRVQYFPSHQYHDPSGLYGSSHPLSNYISFQHRFHPLRRCWFDKDSFRPVVIAALEASICIESFRAPNGLPHIPANSPTRA